MYQVVPCLFLAVLFFFFSACSQKQEEEEYDYERMVKAEDEEWNTERHQDIAGELGPDAQEILIVEEVDAEKAIR